MRLFDRGPCVVPSWPAGWLPMRWLLAGVLLVGFASATTGQNPASIGGEEASPSGQETTGQDVDPQKIEALKQQVESATDIEPEQKDAVKLVLDQASGELAKSETLTSAAESNQQVVQQVQQRLEATQQRMKELQSTQPADFSDAESLTSLETERANRLAELREMEAAKAKQQADLKRQADRRRQIAELQATHPQRLAEAERQLAAQPPGGESSWMTKARTQLQQAKRQSLAAELPALRWELSRYEAEQAVQLPKLELELTSLRQQRIEEELELISRRSNDLRKAKAQSKYTELLDFSEQLEDPTQKRLASRNADLARENEQVAADIAEASKKARRAEDQLDRLVQDFQSARSRVERIGMSGATGVELRRHLSQLPDTRQIRRDIAAGAKRMQAVESRRLDLEDALASLKAQNPSSYPTPEEQKIQDDALEILVDLSRSYDQYFLLLSDFDISQNQLVSEAIAFRNFLNERVLWIRSSRPLGPKSIQEAARSLADYARPSFWQGVLTFFSLDIRRNPGQYFLATLAALLLMLARYRGRHPLAVISRQAAKPTCTDYRLTVRAAVLTFTIAIAYPLVLYFAGFRLTTSLVSNARLQAIGQGLISTSLILATINLIRQTCRDEGLAICHFGWPTRIVAVVRKKLLLLLYFGLPVVFIGVAASESASSTAGDGLERICAIILLSLLMWLLYALLHPRRGALVEQLRRDPESWMTRTHSSWFWIIVGFPLVMIGLVVVGYSYTANLLTWRFGDMLWIGMLLVWLRAMAIRALQINHRVARLENLRQKRELLDQDSVPEAEVLSVEEERVLLRNSGDQVLRILHSGLWLAGALALWMLWSEFIPALNILDTVEISSTTRQVATQTVSASGETIQATETQVEKITPLDLLKGVFFCFVTFTLVRNAPGLIEILILQRLPLDTSLKFAIAMMCRYVILVAGLLAIFGAIGLNWSSLQWLVAALTVGLGFGLQEIFGNFVSGIIILWERPVRIGDVVTLDGVTGKVSRIQMRATTISDWDRKEYIVPNKDFVTGRLLNWTRSDQVSRIVINVGVAYGSDVPAAMSILSDITTQHPLILADPAPTVSFENFGTSTLDLTLRCFLPSLEKRIETITELHLAINDRFKQAGIEIAFPQQDVHIRSTPPANKITDDLSG